MTDSLSTPSDTDVAHRRNLPRLPELDGLRGLAALAVFFHHFMQRWESSAATGLSIVFLAARAVCAYGYLGVDVFFGLSGFLITSLLLMDRTGTNYFHNFYWKRVLRILPVYLIHLLPFALLWPHLGGYILLATFFVANFGSLLHIPIVGPAWTLSIEEQFYLVWPHVVRRLRLQTMYYVAFGLIAFSVVSRVAVPVWKGNINIIYTPYRCDGLALGAVLALQWYSPEGRTLVVRAVLGLLNANWTLLLVVCVQAIALVRFPDLRFGNQLLLTSVNYMVYRLIRFILHRRGHAGFVLAWLGSPLAVYLGAISYALYMYQWFILAEFNQHWQIDPSHSYMVLLAAVLTLGACVALCTLSRYAIELPVQRLRRFVLKPGGGMGRGSEVP